MGKPGRDGAPSPVNPGDSATRQEVCHEGPPTRSRLGRISPGPTRWPSAAERRLVPTKSNLKTQTFVLTLIRSFAFTSFDSRIILSMERPIGVITCGVGFTHQNSSLI